MRITFEVPNDLNVKELQVRVIEIIKTFIIDSENEKLRKQIPDLMAKLETVKIIEK